MRENKLIVLCSFCKKILRPCWRAFVHTKNFLQALLCCVQNPSILKEKIVIVRVDGGLGSQMGQYLLGQAIKKQTGLRIKYDVSWFKKDGYDLNKQYRRDFTLTKVFEDLSFDEASREECKVYRCFYDYELKDWFAYNEEVITSNDKRYLSGYYAHPSYLQCFDNKWYEIFKFNKNIIFENSAIAEKIKSSKNSVAVHVRRGDFVGTPADVATIDYYTKALKEITAIFSTVTIFIFSNDIEWVKMNFPQMENIYFIDANDNDKGYGDLYLMSLCENFIVANSSFSSAASQLSTNTSKYIFYPFLINCDRLSGRATIATAPRPSNCKRVLYEI